MPRAAGGLSVSLSADLPPGCHLAHGVNGWPGTEAGALDEARQFVETIPERIVYAERSMSGDGVHVFVTAPAAPGWKRMVDGLSVERYTRARFIAVTGEVWRP